jgi:microcystin-dependent protein
VSEPFLGEIRIFPLNYAPRRWAMCDGQLMPINQNQALFALLGTTFGGNGQTTFALPNLQGKVPIHAGAGFGLGTTGGQYAHTLTQAEMPMHIHALNASSNNADVVSPVDNVLAQSSQLYGPPAQLAPLDASSNGNIGGSQAHENRQPYLTLTICIALQGIFPSMN